MLEASLYYLEFKASLSFRARVYLKIKNKNNLKTNKHNIPSLPPLPTTKTTTKTKIKLSQKTQTSQYINEQRP